MARDKAKAARARARARAVVSGAAAGGADSEAAGKAEAAAKTGTNKPNDRASSQCVVQHCTMIKWENTTKQQSLAGHMMRGLVLR